MSRVLDITYKEVDFELVPESLLGGWPTEAIRLNLSNYTPLIIMVSSFVIYYLILIPFVFPSTKPFGEASINQRKKISWHPQSIFLSLFGILLFFDCLFPWLQATGLALTTLWSCRRNMAPPTLGYIHNIQNNWMDWHSLYCLAWKESTGIPSYIPSCNYLLAVLFCFKFSRTGEVWDVAQWIRSYSHVFALL